MEISDLGLVDGRLKPEIERVDGLDGG